MPIRFKCPNPECRKSLAVKEQFAGKRVACPACKKPVKVPAPVSAPADVEDVAAAAFADDGPARQQAAASPQTHTIDFTCDYCDAELHLPATESGKQIPCPSCKRIIKVPVLKQEKKDWRDVDKKGPAFAKQDAPARPLGAWDDTRQRANRQDWEDEGLVEAQEEPVPLPDRIRRYALYASIPIGLLVLWWAYSNFLSSSAQQRALAAALAGAEGGKVRPALAGEIHRGAGEFYLRTDRGEAAKEAYAKARSNFSQEKAGSFEHDVLLAGLALSQTGLGGKGDEILGGAARARLEWDEAATEIRQTLQAMSSAEARAAAMRAVARQLAQKGERGRAIGLAKALSASVKGGEKDGGFGRGLLAAQLVSLLLADGKEDDAKEQLKALKEEGESEGYYNRLAHAAGLALKGEYPQAREKAGRPGHPVQRLDALLAVAAVALESDRTDEAATTLKAAFDAAAAVKKAGQKLTPFQLYDLTRLAAHAGEDTQAKECAGALTDKAIRACANLERLRAELKKGAGTAIDRKRVDELIEDRGTAAYALGVEAIARHNTRLGSRTQVLETVENADEPVRPFIQLGVALGEQDRGK